MGNFMIMCIDEIFYYIHTYMHSIYILTVILIFVHIQLYVLILIFNFVFILTNANKCIYIYIYIACTLRRLSRESADVSEYIEASRLMKLADTVESVLRKVSLEPGDDGVSSNGLQIVDGMDELAADAVELVLNMKQMESTLRNNAQYQEAHEMFHNAAVIEKLQETLSAAIDPRPYDFLQHKRCPKQVFHGSYKELDIDFVFNFEFDDNKSLSSLAINSNHRLLLQNIQLRWFGQKAVGVATREKRHSATMVSASYKSNESVKVKTPTTPLSLSNESSAVGSLFGQVRMYQNADTTLRENDDNDNVDNDNANNDNSNDNSDDNNNDNNNDNNSHYQHAASSSASSAFSLTTTSLIRRMSSSNVITQVVAHTHIYIFMYHIYIYIYMHMSIYI